MADHEPTVRGTVPTQAEDTVRELRSRAHDAELGTERAWYVDMAKKAFRGFSVTRVLGVFDGGLAVRTDGGDVLAVPWAGIEYLYRRHDLSLLGVCKNRELELIFSVSGHGRISISANRGKENPGGPLEPVATLVEDTHRTWVADRAGRVLADGGSVTFGEVVLDQDALRLGDRTVPWTESITVGIGDRQASVTIKSDSVERRYDHEKIISPPALRVAITVMTRRAARAQQAPDGTTPIDLSATDSAAVAQQQAARAAAEAADLGGERRWFSTTTAFRGRTIVLGVFDAGFVVGKEGADLEVVPWATVDHVNPDNVVPFKISAGGRSVEIASSGGVFPVADFLVGVVADELIRSYHEYTVERLLRAIEQDGQATFGKVTLDPRGLSKMIMRTQVRREFADVVLVEKLDLPLRNGGTVPQLALVVSEVCDAPAGLAIKLVDVPNLAVVETVVRRLHEAASRATA